MIKMCCDFLSDDIGHTCEGLKINVCITSALKAVMIIGAMERIGRSATTLTADLFSVVM